jgi:hypothetical protein
VWIVDGPVIRFGAPWPKMPFPTRMTVIRLADYGLFIHSPTKLVPSLKAEIDRLGVPRCIVASNRLHYFEARKINSPLMQFPTWLGGVRDPQGSMPAICE